nr:MAG TPA: terminase small subunit [Caudoviricetes sp.]
MSKINDWLEKDKLILLEGWARDGLTDEQIAKNIGISRASLYEWKKKEVDISDALKKGKEIVDFEVENALLKKALGYTITIKEEKLDKDGCVHTLEKDVYIPPDTTAQIFWLKNRKPNNWKDRVETDEDKEAVANASQVIAKIRKVAQEYTDGANRN